MPRDPSQHVLRHAEDRRAIGLAAFHLALVAAIVAGARAGVPTYLLVASVPILACSAFVQLISVHNAMHSPICWKKPHNRAWQCLLSVCIGYPVSIYVPVHNLSHHLGLQTPRDVLRTTEVRHRSNLVNLIHHMAMGTLHLHLLHFAYLGAMRRSRPKWFAQTMCEALCVALYLGTIAFVIGPLAMLAFVFVPAIAGQWLMVGFGYVQHDGCDPDSEFHHSRNFLSPILNWWICDNGYHTGHHNRPGLHWSRGRAAHSTDVVPHMDPRLDERSLTRYMWRTFVWPGKRLRYDGTPVELPAKRTRRELWTPASAITNGASSGAVEG